MATQLTIGMATHRDFDGVYFTLNALRLFHADIMPRCELIVVDNDPGGPQQERLRQFMSHVISGSRLSPSNSSLESLLPYQPFSVQYIPFAEAQGTSAPRDLIFQKAKGDAVLVIDSHVDVWPGSIARLVEYFDQHPDCPDLLQGPLVMDNLRGIATHFDDVWRGGMWGTWGTAWKTPNGGFVSPRQSIDGQVSLFDLLSNQFVETLSLAWPGHEPHLRELGYFPATQQIEPFEIPAQGLGLFACRKDAWLGFNPHFREFGGEEWYIHTKFRQAGHKTLCLPWLKWLHRFADPAAGRHYTRTNHGKIRNYILGLNELNLPLDRLRRHFVEGLSEDPSEPNSDGGLIDEAGWNQLVASPERYPFGEPAQNSPAEDGDQTMASQIEETSLEQLYEQAASIPSDLNDHYERLRGLAAQRELVVELSSVAGAGTTAFLAAQPRQLISVAPSPPANFFELARVRGETLLKYLAGNSLAVEIPECDLLFINTKHNGQHLWAELLRHQAKATRYIVLSHTQTYGQRGEDGGLGLLRAVERLAKQFPRWRVISHHPAGQGLTVLSSRSEDYLTPPPQLWPAANGPGTELKRMLASIGVNPAPTCDCNGRARTMDQWGPAVCRERIDEIVGWMREGQSRWGWKEKLSAAAKAVANGLAFKLNPLDPFPSLIEEAIRQSELKQQQQQDAAVATNP